MAQYAVRDPVHGFIPFDSWDRQIIDHPTFQRLRRIRQLGLTEYVYPGAAHTRFEHSLGTMHLATQMFDAIVGRQKSFLLNQRGYTESGIDRDRRVLRFAALLHDVGHSPFSHSGESLMPINVETTSQYKHEDFSEQIIRVLLRDAIEKHETNDNYEITADMVADLIAGRPNSGSSASARRMIWRPLISAQLDADRCDYLLRDSLHAGVSYGRYDLPRILVTLTLGLDESNDPVIAIEQGGWHAAEGLIIARYMMFTQVYFQHTRLAFDHHIEKALATLLSAPQPGVLLPPEPNFPPPIDADKISAYLVWDDWKTLGLLAAGEGGDHGRYITERNPYRSVYETPEVPSAEDLEEFEKTRQAISDFDYFVGDASKSWYSFGENDLLIVPDDTSPPQGGRPLSSFSRVVAGLAPVAQRRIYVRPSDRDNVERVIAQIKKRG